VAAALDAALCAAHAKKEQDHHESDHHHGLRYGNARHSGHGSWERAWKPSWNQRGGAG